MSCCLRVPQSFLVLSLLVSLPLSTLEAATGFIPKYSQPITHLIDPNWDTPEGMRLWGENIPSDVDWVTLMEQPTIDPIPPNWVIADDFEDPFDSPVITVRWWGSYVGPTYIPDPEPTAPPLDVFFGPGSEDGYVISFFEDLPGPRGDPVNYSRPAQLLGTYTFNMSSIRIKETPYLGWDMHRIYEYEVDLMDGHLEHPGTEQNGNVPAMPNGFYQQPDTRYWISIMAEVGHELIWDDTGATGDSVWVEVPTGKRAIPMPLADPNDPETGHPEGHFWGWHTSPLPEYDVATMGHLYMPGQEWIYHSWNMIQPQHELLDMAFELLTVPEPATCGLLAVGLIASGGIRLRRRA